MQYNEKEVQEFIFEKLQDIKPGLPQEVQADDHLKDEWGLDSLDLVELVARLEHQYQVLIEDEDLEKLYSIQHISNFLLEQQKLN